MELIINKPVCPKISSLKLQKRSYLRNFQNLLIIVFYSLSFRSITIPLVNGLAMHTLKDLSRAGDYPSIPSIAEASKNSMLPRKMLTAGDRAEFR